MTLRDYCKIIKELDIPKDNIKKETEITGAAYAFCRFLENTEVEITYEEEEALIKAKYNNRKDSVILAMAAKLKDLDEEYEREIRNLKHMKELDERVAKRLQKLGIA